MEDIIYPRSKIRYYLINLINKKTKRDILVFLRGDYMDVFGMMGFVFGLIAFTTALTNSNKIKELEKRIDDLEGKS